MVERMGALEQLRDPPSFWRRDPADAPPPQLPATIERRAYPALWLILPVFLIVPLWGIVSVLLTPSGPGEPSILSMLASDEPAVLLAVAAFVAVEMIAVTVFFFPAMRRRTYTVDRVMVSCDSRSPLGRQSWSESLGAYQRVGLLKVKRKGSRLYVVRLIHAQANRCVPLYVTVDGDAARKRQSEWATALHLPTTSQQETQP